MVHKNELFALVDCVFDKTKEVLISAKAVLIGGNGIPMGVNYVPEAVI